MHLTLGMLLHYLGKLKIQIFLHIFSRYGRKYANKLHFKCTDFNSSARVGLTVYAESIYVLFFYQNLVLVTEYHVDC